MPNRPDQHDLEDNSRAKFRLSLPRKWVVRDKSNDYGIDLEVEIFDEDGNSTGLFFWVQLKATDSEILGTILNVSFPIDTLRYYKSLNVPVLLARYSSVKDSFYFKWISNIDLFFARAKSKTHRIKLYNSDEWSDKTPYEIENYLVKVRKFKLGLITLPLPISIEVLQERIKGDSKSIFFNKLKLSLNAYSNIVEVNKPEHSILSVSFLNNALKIEPPESSGCWFHNFDKRDETDFIEGVAKDILLGVAISLINANKLDVGAKIIFEGNLATELAQRIEVFTHVFQNLLNSNYQKQCIDLIGKILDEGESDNLNAIAQLNLAYQTIQNKEKIKFYEQFLKQRLDTAINNGNAQSIGICHYNLGNYYNHINRQLDAIRHYNLCRKNAPIYLNHNYYFSEVASSLFRSGKYSIAASFYKLSLDLKHDIKTIGLYADALLFSGQYEQAAKHFDTYLKNTDKPIDEFVLKFICLKSITLKYNINQQKRDVRKAKEYYEGILQDLKKSPLKKLEKTFNYDLLFYPVWFNIGEFFIKKKNIEDATFCFLTCSVLSNDDVEAWVNSTIGAFSSKELFKLLPCIIKTAYFFNKENYLIKLYSELEKQKANSLISELNSWVEQLLTDDSEEDKRPIMRILNEENRFTDLNEIIQEHKED